MTEAIPKPSYPAREAYRDQAAAASYEADRFSGALGRYRWHREQRAVRAMVEMLPKGVSILDCPCGVGRWWPLLSERASEIKAVDISPVMLAAAEERANAIGVPVSLAAGDAESLELDPGSVDVVFSHALTKHLPVLIKQKVLLEFSRVAREWVLCSFGLVGPLSYAFWRRQDLSHNYPLLPEQLDQFAEQAGLEEVARRRCGTPIGVEHSVLFRRRA